MDAFVFSLNAILPIICVVLLGYFLRRFNFVKDDFISSLNKFNFRYGFMTLIFLNVYSIKSFSTEYIDLAIYSGGAVLVLIALGLFIAIVFIKDSKQKGVVAQACFRSNFAIIGVPLASLLFGEEGGACAAVMIAVSVPLYNVFGVIVLSIFLKDKNSESFAKKAKNIMLQIIKNPLIDGILAGLVCLALRPHLGGWTLKDGELAFIYKTIQSLAGMATPIALICLGAQFKFSAVKRLFPLISLCTFIRLIAAPLFGLSAAHRIFPYFAGPQFAALLALFGTPVAVASAIMADQMGNDGELAGQILVWTTVLSAFTMFGFILFFRSVGVF